MKPLFYLILTYQLLCTLALHAQQTDSHAISDPAAIIARAGEFSGKTMTISADFTQVKEMSFLEEKVMSAGKFYFEKENLLRWEYLRPYSYVIILNASRVRIIDEGKKKDYDAGANRMFMEISGVMSGLVNGTLLQGDRFGQAWYEAENHYRVELIPRDALMKDYLAMIELVISKADFSVDEVKMHEKSGDYTQITFGNKKFNETIASDLFRVD